MIMNVFLQFCFRQSVFLISFMILSAQFSLFAQHTDNNPFTSESQNFYDIQKKFQEEYAKGGYDMKGWKQYKRWEYFMEPRVYPSGVLPDPMATYKALKFSETMRPDNSRTNGNWVSVGPAISSGTGIGRINFVCFHPTDSNIIFVGAPSGGIWKTINGGTSWETTTDFLPAIGFSDMVINPQNPDVIYAASGDGDANDTYSLGVLKSTDGGETWTVTGLNWTVTNTRTIRRLIMNPSNPDILYAATSAGIYKTTNAGTNWTRIRTGGFIDIEFKPGNPSILYAASYGGSWTAGARFYRSLDQGVNWTEITGDFSGKSNRIAIAVTPADSNFVYILASESPTSDNNNRHGFLGFYRSNTGADSFETMAESPNLLGWSTTGSDLTGQGWYDLDLAVSPTNPEIVFVGGVNIWKTENQGKDWALNAHWYGGGGAPWVHADIHYLIFDPRNSNTLYVGCDGGVFRTYNNGRTYSDISQTMVTTQIYKLGISALDPKIALVGCQDNGTKRFQSTWQNVIGGDGMECIVDPTDDQVMYGSLYYGDIQRSTNGGSSFSKIKRNISEQGGWVTPYVLNPKNTKIIIAGYTNIWKNYNRGYSDWVKISDFGGSTKFVAIKIAPSDTNVIYATKGSSLHRTRNGGTSWEDISSGLPVSSASIESIEVRDNNANVVWVCFSGYSAANKVFVSADGGDTWSNYTANLPNLPANCLLYQKGTDNGIYVGMDVGVYYRDSTLTNWISFSEGLPNVIVTELDIYYNSNPSKSRIKASTYGRGLWESEFYVSPSTPPLASFETSDTSVCVGYTVHFTNTSAFSSNYKWYFEGGYPATSTERNPRVRYDNAGTYNVSLVALNSYGQDSVASVDYIFVDPLAICEYIMPTTSAFETYTTCSGKLFDPGGKTNYGSNSNVYITIAPPDANGIVIEFLSFETEKDYDFLEIYDGSDLNSPLIGNYTGSSLPEGGFVISSQGSLTLRFRSDALDNRSGFELNWHCLKDSDPPLAFYAPSSLVSCTGEIAFHDKSLNNPSSYLWKFGDGNTSTEENPVHLYRKNGIFTVWLIVSNQNGSDSISKENIVIEMPDIPETFPANSCGSDSLILRAEGDGTILWFANENDSSILAEGNEFTTPVLTETKTYYAQKREPGNLQFAGPFANNIGTGGYSSGTQGLVFNTSKKIRINSVKVYASGSGKRLIQIKNGSGQIVFSDSFYLSGGENRINLQAVVDKGDNNTLIGVNANLYRNNSGMLYPYESGDLVTIISSTGGTNYYYYFYDWEVIETDACHSPKVPVMAAIFNNPPAASFAYTDSGLYYTFKSTSSNGFSYLWIFGDGDSSTSANPEHKFENSGSYTVKLIVENACGIDSLTQTVQVTNSIFEEEKTYSMHIFPNPNNGAFKLTYEGPGMLHLRILDLNGQLIEDKHFDNAPEKLILDLHIRQSSGIYYIQAITQKEVITDKIFVK